MIMFWVSLQAVSRLLCVLLGGLDLAKAPSVQSHVCPRSAGMHFGRRPTEWLRRPIKRIWPESSRLLSPDFADVSVGRETTESLSRLAKL